MNKYLVYNETSLYMDKEYRERFGSFGNIIYTELLSNDVIICAYE